MPDGPAPRPRGTPLPPAEGLLAALVIAPGTYPRNRFFHIFRDPTLLRVRRRASHLRGLVRHLLSPGRTVIESRVRDDAGRETIRYRIDDLSLVAEVRLEPHEAAVLDVALAIARRETPDEAQLARVTLALSGLGDFGPKVPEPVEGVETVELSVVACDEPTRT